MMVEYEYRPQHEYLIDGIPARIHGEWPGLTSCKWNGSIKVIHPVSQRKVFNDDCLGPIRNRRHFSAVPPKEESTHNIGLKSIPQRKSLEEFEEKKVGLRKVGYTFSQGKIDFQRKHYEEQFGINNDPEIFHIRTFCPDGNSRSFKELPIEKALGGKRLIGSIIQQRNGLLMKAPGDKSYKHSEHTDGYFKEGGLIVGSSNRLNHNRTLSRNTNNYYDTLNINAKTLNPSKLWVNKVKSEQYKFETDYVQMLGNWEKKILVDYVPSLNEKENKLQQQLINGKKPAAMPGNQKRPTSSVKQTIAKKK